MRVGTRTTWITIAWLVHTPTHTHTHTHSHTHSLSHTHTYRFKESLKENQKEHDLMLNARKDALETVRPI
jgi:hypothetical protein